MFLMQGLDVLKSGTIIAACSDETAACIELVRTWCKGYGYTADDVRIVKRDGKVIAELKRDSEK